MAISLTVEQALAYENDPSQIPPNTDFNISDTAANAEKLTVHDIIGLSSQLNITSIVSTNGPVTFTPGGAAQTALTNHGINITARISVSEAIALDVEVNVSGGPLIVPSTEHLIVLDTAANLGTLTPTQITDLGNAVDTATAAGDDSGKGAVTKIAATDAPVVFTPNQVNALGNARMQRSKCAVRWAARGLGKPRFVGQDLRARPKAGHDSVRPALRF